MTGKGKKAYEHHKNFHMQMTNAVIENLKEQELAILLQTLDKLSDFFRGYQEREQEKEKRESHDLFLTVLENEVQYLLNLRKVGDNSHVPAVWFAAEPEDKRSNIRFVFYQEGIDMAAKKGASKTTAKTTVQTPVKTAEEVTSAQTAKKLLQMKRRQRKRRSKPAK